MGMKINNLNDLYPYKCTCGMKYTTAEAARQCFDAHRIAKLIEIQKAVDRVNELREKFLIEYQCPTDRLEMQVIQTEEERNLSEICKEQKENIKMLSTELDKNGNLTLM